LRMAAALVPNAIQTPASEQTDCKNFDRTRGSVRLRNLPILRVAAFFMYLSLNAAMSSFAGWRSIIGACFLVFVADLDVLWFASLWFASLIGVPYSSYFGLRLGDFRRFNTRRTIEGVGLSGLGTYRGFGLALGSEFKKLSGFFLKTGTQSLFILRVNASRQYWYLLPLV